MLAMYLSVVGRSLGTQKDLNFVSYMKTVKYGVMKNGETSSYPKDISSDPRQPFAVTVDMARFANASLKTEIRGWSSYFCVSSLYFKFFVCNFEILDRSRSYPYSSFSTSPFSAGPEIFSGRRQK